MNCSLDWLSDPEVFEVNRLPAHSDHIVYSNIDELKIGKSSLYQSLNGKWKFSYAVNPDKRKSNFYADSFDTDSFDEITVPGHIELQGFGKPHYVNTMYPWEGKEHLRPPFVSKKKVELYRLSMITPSISPVCLRSASGVRQLTMTSVLPSRQSFHSG